MFNLSETNDELIEAFLADKDLHKNLPALLRRYVQAHPDKLTDVLLLTSSLSAIAMEEKRQALVRKTNALEKLIFIAERQKEVKKLGDEQYVVWAWQPVKEYFPEGHAGGESQLAKEFFGKFVSALKNAAQLIDSDWANRLGCSAYLKLVLRNSEQETAV